MSPPLMNSGASAQRQWRPNIHAIQISTWQATGASTWPLHCQHTGPALCVYCKLTCLSLQLQMLLKWKTATSGLLTNTTAVEAKMKKKTEKKNLNSKCCKSELKKEYLLGTMKLFSINYGDKLTSETKCSSLVTPVSPKADVSFSFTWCLLVFFHFALVE